MRNMERLLGILGFFLLLALSINAFFLRGIYQDIGDVNVNIARIFERGDATEKIITELKASQRDLTIRMNKLEREVRK